MIDQLSGVTEGSSQMNTWPAAQMSPGPLGGSLNRLRVQKGRCRAIIKTWKLSHTDVCDCGERQTMSHLMTCVDAPNCTWTDRAMPTLAGVIEESMKKKNLIHPLFIMAASGYFDITASPGCVFFFPGCTPG